MLKYLGACFLFAPYHHAIVRSVSHDSRYMRYSYVNGPAGLFFAHAAEMDRRPIISGRK